MSASNAIGQYFKNMVASQDRYILYLFLLCFLLIWNPSKAPAYIVPYLFTLGILVYPGVTRSDWKLLESNICIRMIFVLAVLVIHSIITVAAYGEFNIPNFVIFSLTYSAAAFFICVDSVTLKNAELTKKITLFLAYVVIIEALIGIIQAVISYHIHGTLDSDSGDLVTGTFDLLNVIPSERGFSNPIYAINMSCCIIFLASQSFNFKLKATAIVLGVLSILLASVMHVTIFLAAALPLAIFLTRANPISIVSLKLYAKVIVVELLIFCVVWLILPNNLSNLSKYMKQLAFEEVRIEQVDPEKSEVGEVGKSTAFKKIALYRQLVTIPTDHLLQPVLGFGAGQFNSKAALIGTGLYFGSPDNPIELPMLTPDITWATEQYVFDLWMNNSQYKYGGSSTAPWSSWLALVGEFGAVALLVMFTALIAYARKISCLNYIRDNEGICLIWLLTFLFLIGYQEHYWETPQAIFTGLFLFKLLEGNSIGKSFGDFWRSN